MNMTDPEKIEFATEVFTTLVGDKQDRLRRGLMLRQAMHDAQARGEIPAGYRAPWLNAKVLDVARLMVKISEEFDAAHPDDRCSVSDILDILLTAHHRFKTQAKG